MKISEFDFQFEKNVECNCKKNRFSRKNQMITSRNWYTTCFRRQLIWIIKHLMHVIYRPMPFGWKMPLCWTTYSPIRKIEMHTILYSVDFLCVMHSKSVGLLVINSRKFATVFFFFDLRYTKSIRFFCFCFFCFQICFIFHIGNVDQNWNIFPISVSIDQYQFRR